LRELNLDPTRIRIRMSVTRLLNLGRSTPNVTAVDAGHSGVTFTVRRGVHRGIDEGRSEVGRGVVPCSVSWRVEESFDVWSRGGWSESTFVVPCSISLERVGRIVTNGRDELVGEVRERRGEGI